MVEGVSAWSVSEQLSPCPQWVMLGTLVPMAIGNLGIKGMVSCGALRSKMSSTASKCFVLGVGEGCSELGGPQRSLVGSPEGEEDWESTRSCGIPARG